MPKELAAGLHMDKHKISPVVTIETPYPRVEDIMLSTDEIRRLRTQLAWNGSMPAAQKFHCMVSRIVLEEGFVIHPDKIRLMGQGIRQTVTGVVVNQTLGLSRQERRRLRAMAHQLSRQSSNATLSARHAGFQGKVADLSMLNQAQALPFKSYIS